MISSSKLNLINTQVKPNKINPKEAFKPSYAVNNNISKDTISFNLSSLAAKPQISFTADDKEMRLVSPKRPTGAAKPAEVDFREKLQPALQMKVRGVSYHQEGTNVVGGNKDNNINRLAEADWKDGQPMTFEVVPGAQGKQIQLFVDGFGEVGRVPDEIAYKLLSHVGQYMDPHHRGGDHHLDKKNQFKFELSNIIAGTTTSASTIGLRVNFKYTGNDPKIKKQTEEAVNTVLNDPKASKMAYFYQPKVDPKQLLGIMLQHEKDKTIEKAERQVESNVHSIAKEIVLDEVGGSEAQKLANDMFGLLKGYDFAEDQEMVDLYSSTALDVITDFKEFDTISPEVKNELGDAIKNYIGRNVNGLDQTTAEKDIKKALGNAASVAILDSRDESSSNELVASQTNQLTHEIMEIIEGVDLNPTASAQQKTNGAFNKVSGLKRLEEASPSKLDALKDNLGKYFNRFELGDIEKAKMEAAINTISKELKNPEHKRILIIGHIKPDGDTIGCSIGLKNALDLKNTLDIENAKKLKTAIETGEPLPMDVFRDLNDSINPDRSMNLKDPKQLDDLISTLSEKQIECAIDDSIPGLFRHKIPYIDEQIKRPPNPERVKKLQQTQKAIEKELKTMPNNKGLQTTLELVKNELEYMKNPDNLIKSAKDNKYDLAVLVDIPTPKRFTGTFKDYIQDAKKVIYIDHHPHRAEEWESAKDYTGFDAIKSKNENLAWIADAVPAATEMVGSLVTEKLLPVVKTFGSNAYSKSIKSVFPNEDDQNKFKAMVASLVTGASTDTGQFGRTANYLPEDVQKPAQQRPNFWPESFSKYMLDLTKDLSEVIDKKWLRENISHELSHDTGFYKELAANDQMQKIALANKIVEPQLGLAILKADYDEMQDVWHREFGQDEDVNLLDIQNAFKYSSLMSMYRSDPSTRPQINEDSPIKPNGQVDYHLLSLQSDYKGPYDDDRIAILVCQDKKAGELDDQFDIAKQNGLRLSLRSNDGSMHAEFLASLFGGGGHGGASGGRIDLPDVDLDTKLAVKVGNHIETDPLEIIKHLKANYESVHDKNISSYIPLKTPMTKYKPGTPIEVIKLDDAQKMPGMPKNYEGRTCTELINDVVKEIRSFQTPSEAKKEYAGYDKNQVPDFDEIMKKADDKKPGVSKSEAFERPAKKKLSRKQKKRLKREQEHLKKLENENKPSFSGKLIQIAHSLKASSKTN